MSDQSFSLHAFPAARSLASLTIEGSIARRANTLAIQYALKGHLAALVIPAPAAIPSRQRGLWEETCFEFFLARKDSPRYWEFNLSPAGHWNAYRFAAYRQGMEEEPAFTSLPFCVESRSGFLSLALELDLDKIVQAAQPVEVAISAVMKHRDGEATYWALTHGGAQADFHRRDGFTVAL